MAVNVIESGDGTGRTAQVSGGRLHTLAQIDCVSRSVYTSQITNSANVVGTLSSRSGRCSMFFMNTGANTVYVRLGAADPTNTDFSLAPGEKFTVPFATDTEVRFVATAGNWSVVAVEGAQS